MQHSSVSATSGLSSTGFGTSGATATEADGPGVGAVTATGTTGADGVSVGFNDFDSGAVAFVETG